MKTINRISILLCCVVMAMCAMPLDAQEIMDGAVKVRDLSVARSDDKLHVYMNIDVTGLKINTNREVTLIPEFVNGADSLRLPSVTVAGRSRYYYHLRNDEVVSPSLHRLGEVAVLEYSTAVPYEKWMDKAQLVTVAQIAGCCNEELGGGKYGPLLTLSLEPKKFVPDFVYVRPVAKQKINTLEGSAYIDFPVNRTEIYPDYRRNPEELRKIISTIDAVRNDADTRIMALTIKGFASPEGSYSNNVRLAKGRTAALKDYVQSLYSFPDSIISTSFEPEDWAGLEKYLLTCDLAERDAILGLVRSTMEPDAKDALIKRTFPADYAFLLKNVYPALRHSDYTVRYEVRAYTDVAEIRRLLKTAPAKLSLNEMYLVAQEMHPGSREFDETFEVAVHMFPDDAVANLNAANAAMQSGDLDRAARYVANAGSSAEADYARGTLAAIKGEYDKALVFFGEASGKGLAKAADMISQINEIIK